MHKGRIFNIQHFCVHDGPGIRTTVFFKGCPLRCRWCANPESQQFQKELSWNRNTCIHCGECTRRISGSDCRFAGEELYWNREVQPDEDTVKRVCPAQALEVIGEDVTADDVMKSVEEDRVFYGPDGGLTLSGGEPLSQIDFALDLLAAAKKKQIHTAIETCGFVAWEYVKTAAMMIDYYLTDIKVIDAKKHEDFIGVSNELILDNLRRLSRGFPSLPIHVRTPVIPGFNDDPLSVRQIGAFLSGLHAENHVSWELLKYHRLGAPKYESLHRTYEMGEEDLPQERFDEMKEIAHACYGNVL